jgi:hypothetical protein
MDDNISITTDFSLDLGDVALIFKPDGNLAIKHNVTDVRLTGMVAGKDSGGFLLAIACTIALGNETLSTELIKLASMKLDKQAHPGASGTVQ